MPLSPDQIEALLNKPKRGGGKKKTTVITERTYQVWFKLAHKMLDEEGELARCTNPDCEDPRRVNDPDYRGIVVANVNGTFMCRFCFLDGWKSEDAQQLLIEG